MSGPFAEQTPDHTAAKFGPNLGAHPLLTAAEQVMYTHEQIAHDLARRILRGERITARHLVAGLRAQTLRAWWGMIVRHSREEGRDAVHVLTRYASWIGGYLVQDLVAPTFAIGEVTVDPALLEEDLALMHLDYGFSLLLCSAAREFLATASTFPPTGPEEPLLPEVGDPADRRGNDESQSRTTGLAPDAKASQLRTEAAE